MFSFGRSAVDVTWKYGCKEDAEAFDNDSNVMHSRTTDTGARVYTRKHPQKRAVPCKYL